MADLRLELDPDVDPEEAVTRGDLVRFGQQIGDALLSELDRRDLARRRVDAERERLAPRGNAGAAVGNGDQDDDEAAFRRMAQRAGLSPEAYAAAIAAAKKAETMELVRECLDEYLPEVLPDALEELIEEMAEEDEPTGRRAGRANGKSQRSGKAKKSGTSQDAGQAPRAPRDSAPVDEAPENLHWSERPLFGRKGSS